MTYDPSIPLLSLYSEKTMIRKDTYSPTFIEALFIIVKTWKHPRCPSGGERIKLTWRLLFSRSVVSDSLQPHGLQHARLLRPPLSPRVCSDSCRTCIQSLGTALVAQRVKRPPAMRETWVLPLGEEDSMEKGNSNPLQYSCLENPFDGETSPWGHKESDTTEHLHFHTMFETT